MPSKRCPTASARNGLEHPLSERYDVYHHQLNNSFEDVLEDFFLYLREGSDNGFHLPYQSLRRIKNKDTFETWLLNTFRNYLSNRAAAEEKIFTTSDPDNVSDDAKEAFLTNEQKLDIA